MGVGDEGSIKTFHAVLIWGMWYVMMVLRVGVFTHVHVWRPALLQLDNHQNNMFFFDDGTVMR
jgi:hypothetical protein